MTIDLGPRSSSFDIVVRHDLKRASIVLRGELDVAAVARCDAAFAAVLDGDVFSLAVDLTDLTFCDSSGLRSLARGTDRCEDRGIEVRLLRPSQVVQRALRLSGLDAFLGIDPIDSLDGDDAA